MFTSTKIRVCVLLVVRIKKISPPSPHYLPEQQEADRFICSLKLQCFRFIAVTTTRILYGATIAQTFKDEAKENLKWLCYCLNQIEHIKPASS